MSWAGRRQFTYLSGLIIVIALILFISFYNVIFKAPNCNDNIQNGSELGVDCGGLCMKLCSAQVSEPVILWSRAFHVSGSSYNVLAYVENQNKNGAAEDVPYEFRVYDQYGILISTRTGKTFIPPNQRFAVFESRIDVGSSIPKSVTFDFQGKFFWYKKDPTIQTQPIKIQNKILNNESESPVITADVVNDSVYDLPAFNVIAIVYDENHNAIGVSSTHAEGVKSNGKLPISFTWPEAFNGKPVLQDLLLSVDPFTTPF
jgi:hypothetical protein